MSEYWVSQGKFWCKYCKVYIADDKPSRSHHESGGRHKGNLERYIRNIYKQGAKAERDKANEARELQTIDAAAARAMGISPEQAATPSASTSGTAGRRPKASASSGDAYSTAASLGFVDEDAEQREKERQLRAQEGYAGEWSIVTPATTSTPRDLEETAQEEALEGSAPETKPRDLETTDNRTFTHSHFKEKSLPALDDEDYDQVAIKVRKPREVQPSQDLLAKAREQARTQAPADSLKKEALASNGKLKFKAVQAQEYEETPEEQQQRAQAAWALIDAKAEDDDSGLTAKAEATDFAAPSAPMFKKRKAKSSEAGSNKRSAVA